MDYFGDLIINSPMVFETNAYTVDTKYVYLTIFYPTASITADSYRITQHHKMSGLYIISLEIKNDKVQIKGNHFMTRIKFIVSSNYLHNNHIVRR